MASIQTYGYTIHWSFDVWLPRYAQMVADVGVFKVAKVPTNWYEYSIPIFVTLLRNDPLVCLKKFTAKSVKIATSAVQKIVYDFELIMCNVLPKNSTHQN